MKGVESPYDGFKGMKLSRIELGRFDMVLHLERHDGKNNRQVSLSTDSDIALSKDQIFKRTDSHFPVPIPGVLDRLFSFIEKKVTVFEPLKLNRACRLGFENGELFFWLKPDDITDNIFLARVNCGEDQGNWWLIDDSLS